MPYVNSDISEFTVKVKEAKTSADEKSHLLVDKNGNIIVNSMEPIIDVPAEIEEKAEVFIGKFHNFLKEGTERYLKRLEEKLTQPIPKASGPMLGSGYQYWNALTIGPIQFYGDPPYRPSKIIRAGELALMLGVVWVNPANSDGGGLPGTLVLSERGYRVRFETINLTNVTDGPDATFVGKFPAPAPVINIFRWYFRPTDPGLNPNLFETTLTADITNLFQPLAAFSTWHYDVDREPSFLWVPEVRPEWQHDIPAKFMVYRP